MASAQNNAITQLWQESNGLYSSKFDVPTTVDNSDNFYRAGFEKHLQGGTDVKLQKIDEEGTLLWTATVAASGGGTGVDVYEPTKITTDGTNIYITGIVTYLSSGETDFFVSQVNSSGAVQWFTLDVTSGNDVTSDIIYDGNTSSIYVTGTTERNGDYDMLLAAYNQSGVEQWLVAKDYNGNADLGAVVMEDGGNFIVNGSSQQNNVQWDIASWVYDDGGNFVSHSRNTGLTAASHQLEDAAVANGHINITGSAINSSLQEFKVVCLDANTNYLWQNTYSKNSLPASGTALVSSANSFVAVGYVTHATGNENILVRKYSLSGTLLWSQEFDKAGGNDRGVDIIEDGDGNYLLLADVTDGGQKDVYIYYLDGSSGGLEWSERVSDDAGLDETGISLEAAFGGEVYVTYEVNNLSVTEAYSYSEIDFPVDGEPFSKSNFYIANSGQLKDINGQSAMDIRYYSFGLNPEMYFSDDAYSVQVLDPDDDEFQRIDFSLVNSLSTHVGFVEEYDKETHFNYYKAHGLKYEQQGSYDVLAWPDIYVGIDAFASTNSEGFKLTFVLEDGSTLDDIELDIDGSGGFSISGGQVVIQTETENIVYLEPFSYEQESPEIVDDDCIEYVISNGNLKFSYTCQGDLAYPYVIVVKVGVGSVYSAASIENMDWSTFFGGNSDDGAYSVDVDSDQNIFVGGYSSSTQLNINSGISVRGLTSANAEQGMVAKFLGNNLKIAWVSFLAEESIIKNIKLFDVWPANPNFAPEELHFVGEATDEFTVFNNLGLKGITNPFLHSFDYADSTDVNRERDLIIGTMDNSIGTLDYVTAFGGYGTEFVHGMDITTNSNNEPVMYFVGSTDHGSILAAMSQRAPGTVQLAYNEYFPVYKPTPSDGSYHNLGGSAVGVTRGFAVVFNLKNYTLDYSTLLPDFEVVYDISLDGGYTAFCGKGSSDARIGRWQPASTILPTSSSTHNFSNLDFFSSVINRGSDDLIFFGINETKPHSLQSGTLPSFQYQTSTGEGYLMRLNNTSSTPVWDTYFGQSADQANSWSSSEPLIKDAFGRLAFNPSTSTFFAVGSASSSPVQTQPKTGFFTESVISSSSSTFADGYLAAFTDNILGANVFTWGTIFGGAEREFVTDIVSYDNNGTQYLITTGVSFSEVGSTTSNDDDYPVVNPGGVSHYRQNNTTALSAGFSDAVITMFDISNVQTISTKENNVNLDSFLRIFPNPTNQLININLLQRDDISSVMIHDASGKCVFNHVISSSHDKSNHLVVNIENLKQGVYIVNVNNLYHAKIVKN